MLKKSKIFLIAGSTGGHALPILFLSEGLKNLGQKVTIFVSGTVLEKELFRPYHTVKIISGKLDRHNAFNNIFGSISLLVGFIEAFFYLFFYRPKLVISKGGFLAVPVLLASRLLQIPYFTHESDSEIGLTNKMFMEGAREFFVGFPTEVYGEEIKKSNAKYIGQIIRREFAETAKSNISNKKPIIFITGGSQGSKRINEVVLEIVPELLNKYQIIHQVGEYDISNIRFNAEGYSAFSFSIKRQIEAMISADLIIGRAGATTIGEISALKKASILIPYPYASSDHQTKNAKYMERAGGAIMIKEENLTPKLLLLRINYLMKDRKNLEVIGKNAEKAIKYNGLSEMLIRVKKIIEE